VLYVISGGAPPPHGEPTPVHRSVAGGVEVRVIPAGDGTAVPVATAMTDDQGP